MKFKNVYIETINVCNLSCSFCPKTTRAARAMSAAEFLYVLNNVAPHTEYVYLHVMGEPLLNPELDQMLRFAEQKNVSLKLTTNGTLLKQNINTLCACKCLRGVNISLSCIKDFEKSAAQQYLDDVLFAAQKLKNSGITTTLRVWINTKHNDIIKNAIFNQFGVGVDLPFNGVQKIADHLLLNSQNEFIWPVDSKASPNVNHTCLGLRKQIAILCDGTVVPCCLDSEGTLNLGNIFTNNLSVILLGKRAKAIAQGFKNSRAVEPFCQTCTFYTRT